MLAQSACLYGANRLRGTIRPCSRTAVLGWLIALAAAGGCLHDRTVCCDGLAEHILPPPSVAAAPPGADTPGSPGAPPSHLPDAGDKKAPAKTDDAAPQETIAVDGAACKPMSLQEAIALAFRLQPQLRVFLESIQQARGREDVAFAAFLPTASADYLEGGYHIQAGGLGFPIPGVPNSPNFTIFPLLGSVPVGLQGQTDFGVADLKLQWLLCDFGRRLSQYNQSGIALDIAQLRTQRAYQTTADEVATAYYQVLRTAALRRIAEEAVRRADDDLELARKLQKGDVVLRENVLRNEVELARARHELDDAEAAAAVAGASLNLAIGLNVSAPPTVEDVAEAPPFGRSLTDCLQTAVDRRRELRVARAGVAVAQQGVRAARADFAPRIVAEGSLIDFQQSNPRGHFDLPFAVIKLEWGLFEGGKRVAEVRVADSHVREAMSQAESIADTVAFQVNEAYRLAVAARKGIDRARPAVDQAGESYRLVRARYKEGEAIPSDLIEAETALVRAQESYYNSVYDYLIALARLDYAMGTSPTPDSLPSDGAGTTQCTTTTHQEPSHDRTESDAPGVVGPSGR
jgi:outer membrane protein TolC